MDVAFGIGPFSSIGDRRSKGEGKRSARLDRLSTRPRTHKGNENESRADSNADRLINYPSSRRLERSVPNPSHVAIHLFFAHEGVYPSLELEAARQGFAC